ncbi:MAG: hypothetical protein ACYC27_05750 [Armatimonadota bacterium]
MVISRMVTVFILIMAMANTVTVSGDAGNKQSKGAGYNMNKLAGQSVDIASSAYQYRADRKTSDNPPESWIAFMHYADLPLNKPVDLNNKVIKQALCSLLWEEIRPVQKLELTWASNANRKPAPDELSITTLAHQGSASSWWNNLDAVKREIKPVVSADGMTYIYTLDENTCGIVTSVAGDKTASEYDVPSVRVLVADKWKKMEIEIEWGFDDSTASSDYSGRIETYDGMIDVSGPLDADKSTLNIDSKSWTSSGVKSERRGIKASLLYMGTSKWREEQPYTTQKDDVARTIVTLWTKSGNFSFLAADLENGPILAPEYGFFIRRTSRLAAPIPKKQAIYKSEPKILISPKMNSIADDPSLLGWGSNSTPWFGGNPTDKSVSPQGINMPARCIAMHPGFEYDVAVGWRSPVKGTVKINGSLTHAQAGSNGIEWWIRHETNNSRKDLIQGSSNGTGSQVFPSNADDGKIVDSIQVEPGDTISLVVGPKGRHEGDTNITDFVITEAGGQGRVWNLNKDVIDSIHAGNPHSDSLGNADVWHFYMEKAAVPFVAKPLPPIKQASKAASAREFINELKARKLKTIRQQIGEHEEQTWLNAVTSLCGIGLPAHPKPPVEFEPPMKVSVPSGRLTAQWNLGNWHLLRHAQINPKNGRLWFDDFPYGILAAETYMVLQALDLMGSHKAAEDGFDQWVSLPMQPDSTGHHPWALPDRPNGLFTEGYGCLTHAVGPDGVGGQMDGVHAFGPGSIGLALTEHYWMTGDIEWLKASALRIKANAEWMLRQRQVVRDMVPGGSRLWCKGLQPALQVTPDSGGLWMQFYECEAYYWASISRLAAVLSVVDPVEGAKLQKEADAYYKDLREAVERSIALSPVVQVRDGTYHSVIPFACYVRGLGTGAWGWQRDGSGSHVGPLYWETVQSAAALISPAGLLPVDDVRVQGYLDVLEDRLLLENENAKKRSKGDWFMAGWQYQGGLERTANMHLISDDVPVFLRSFLNCYAVDVIPESGYIFNEHAVHGPPDKIFEEAAFLERFRNMLVMEDGQDLWITRAVPREWLEQRNRISVKNAPTHFGEVSYEIESDVLHNIVKTQIEMPDRIQPDTVILRLRHPDAKPIKSVTVNGVNWTEFDNGKEVIYLKGQKGTVTVEARY